MFKLKEPAADVKTPQRFVLLLVQYSLHDFHFFVALFFAFLVWPQYVGKCERLVLQLYIGVSTQRRYHHTQRFR